MAEILTVIVSKEIHKRFDLGWLKLTKNKRQVLPVFYFFVTHRERERIF